MRIRYLQFSPSLPQGIPTSHASQWLCHVFQTSHMVIHDIMTFRSDALLVADMVKNRLAWQSLNLYIIKITSLPIDAEHSNMTVNPVLDLPSISSDAAWKRTNYMTMTTSIHRFTRLFIFVAHAVRSTDSLSLAANRDDRGYWWTIHQTNGYHPALR